jgi:hypothetical protein
MRSSHAWRFPLRRVGLGEASALLQASLYPFRAAGLRLLGLYLLLWIPIVLFAFAGALGPSLFDIYAALAFTGYTCALDAASRSELPDLRHLGVALRFGPDKLMLLVLTGVLPRLAAIAVMWSLWGIDETARFLDALAQPQSHPVPAMKLLYELAQSLAQLPFTFVAPVWALYRWSASRSMAANLLACWVNWRWVLAMTVVTALIDDWLIWLKSQGDALEALSVIATLALNLLLLAWTLALVHRSFPER